jgi:hypothetical protein
MGGEISWVDGLAVVEDHMDLKICIREELGIMLNYVEVR